MTLSIIIVNYNVRHFLEQCLHSVMCALEGVDGEVIVIDNASVDDSAEMVLKTFPPVRWMPSPTNLGFSRANNLGVSQARGEYLLFLNPDTLVGEDCFVKCLQFFVDHPDAGALGVKMLDGAGHLLPESKRGFPGVWNAFCKMTGLSTLFSRSALFNGYYLGHLSYDETNAVDALSGAFMMMPAKVFREAGGFDEAYFMYGEDIDLSYQIAKAGYRNYYYPDVSILHFKGESTRKVSLNYFSAFYRAMAIFYKKHLSGSSKAVVVAVMQLFIWTHAFIAALRKFVTSVRYPLADAIFFCLGFYLIQRLWSVWYFGQADYLNHLATQLNVAIFVTIWVAAFFYQGAYEKRYSLKDLILASIWGFLLNLMLYALLPESWRASRMVLVLSFFLVTAYALISRLAINLVRKNRWIIGRDHPLHVLVIGDPGQFDKVEEILSRRKPSTRALHQEVREVLAMSPQQWEDFLRDQQIGEIVLCEQNMSWKEILQFIAHRKGQGTFRILTKSGQGIVGSPSRDSQGEIYHKDFDYHLSQAVYKRQKRLFDFSFSLVLLAFSWLLIFLYKHRIQFIRNAFDVISGNATWVSYAGDGGWNSGLPVLKPGILKVVSDRESQIYGKEIAQQLIRNYAWNYTVWLDLDICLKQFLNLDQNGNGIDR